jgi:hypothetical protein
MDLRNNLPRTWDTTAVSSFHEVLAALQQAFGEDLSSFRIPGATQPLSSSEYCSEQIALQQLEGVHSYLQRLQSGTPRSPEQEPVPLTERQRTRLANAEKELRDAVRSRQPTRELNRLSGPERAVLNNTPAEDVSGILSLELDVRKYVIDEINVLAEAAWNIRPLERFTEHIDNCASEAVEHGLAMLDSSDRRDVNRTMLENIAAGVAYYWTNRARIAFTLSGGSESRRAPSTGAIHSVVIQLPREGKAQSPQAALPFCDYPKYKYSWKGAEALVKSLDEEKALGGGWADNPAAFAPYEDPRRARPHNPDPLRWVDQWNVTNLSAEIRQAVKVAILRAHAAFWKLPDAPSADCDSMRLAFTGIASALSDAGILTKELLENEIPLLVWDSAVAGGWWYRAAEMRTEIFPHRIGHYWGWLEEDRDWQGLFRAETAEWHAKLLEVPSPEAAAPNPVASGTPKGGDAARLAAIPCQESAEGAMADLADLPEQSRNRIEFIRAQAELDLEGSQPTEENATGYVLRVFTTILEEAVKAARKEGWTAERLRCFVEKHRESEIDDAYYSRHPAGLDPEAFERYMAFDRRRGFGDGSLGSIRGTFRGRVLQRISSSPEWKDYLRELKELADSQAKAAATGPARSAAVPKPRHDVAGAPSGTEIAGGEKGEADGQVGNAIVEVGGEPAPKVNQGSVDPAAAASSKIDQPPGPEDEEARLAADALERQAAKHPTPERIANAAAERQEPAPTANGGDEGLASAHPTVAGAKEVPCNCESACTSSDLHPGLPGDTNLPDFGLDPLVHREIIARARTNLHSDLMEIWSRIWLPNEIVQFTAKHDVFIPAFNKYGVNLFDGIARVLNFEDVDAYLDLLRGKIAPAIIGWIEPERKTWAESGEANITDFAPTGEWEKWVRITYQSFRVEHKPVVGPRENDIWQLIILYQIQLRYENNRAEFHARITQALEDRMVLFETEALGRLSKSRLDIAGPPSSPQIAGAKKVQADGRPAENPMEEAEGESAAGADPDTESLVPELFLTAYEKIIAESQKRAGFQEMPPTALKRVSLLDILNAIWAAWKIAPSDVTPDLIESVLYLLCRKYPGGVELDPMSCQAVGVDHLALAKNIRNSLSRWANPVGSMLAPKLPQTAAGVENTVQEPQDDKPIIQGTMPDLAQWRRQQEDIAIQKARDILNSRPGWAQSQLALTQAEEDFDKTLHLDSWQRALNYYRATGKAWLEIVSDNETLQAFYTILPVIMEGMYWKCLGITPDTFRATSPPAHQFEQDLRDGDKDFRKRAAERAIRGPEPTPVPEGERPGTPGGDSDFRAASTEPPKEMPGTATPPQDAVRPSVGADDSHADLKSGGGSQVGDVPVLGEATKAASESAKAPQPHARGAGKNTPRRTVDLKSIRERVELADALARELAIIKQETRAYCTAEGLKRKYPKFILWTVIEDSQIKELAEGQTFSPRAYAENLMLAKYGLTSRETTKKYRRRLRQADKAK